MASNRRLTRSDKVKKRLRGVKPGVGLDYNSLVHIVNVYAAKAPTTLHGYLVSINGSQIVFRHKKTAASKKTRISHFNRSEVIEVFGKVGEVSSVTLIRRTLLNSVRGYVTNNKDGSLTVEDAVSGEEVTIFPSDFIQLEVYADEEGQKVRKLKSKKRKETVEEDDDSDEEDFEDEDSEESDDDDLEDEDDEDDSEDEDDEDEDEDSDEEDEDEDSDDDDLEEDDEDDEDDDSDDEEDEDEDLDEEDEDEEDEDEDDDDL